MSLAELLRAGLIKKFSPEPEQAQKLLAIAKRDLEVAVLLLEKNRDASFMHSYNSILQSCRALMFFVGYRAVEEEHKTALKFAALFLPDFEHAEELDRFRRKRHIATYDEVDTVSKYEAEYALKVAGKLYAEVSKKIA